jgi:hypothetical protein
MFLSLYTQAQLLDMQQLQVNGTLPETLLNSRSVVLVRNAGQETGQGESWKLIAEKAHEHLKNVGVDAVAYYDWRNVNAGPDATTAFAQAFRQRAIRNLLVLDRSKNGYTLTVAPMGNEGIINKGAVAWQESGPELANIMTALRAGAGKASMEVENFLIIDRPEFFYTTDIKLNKRFFSYALDLKMDKLAVPSYEIFQEGDSTELPELKAVMQAYPYEWGITTPGTEEKDLRLKEGYQYVLLYLHTNAANIRRFLNYGSNDDIPLELQADETDNRSVYKFYIRHIYTGDVYGGTNWDAAPTWQEALENHLRYLRKEQVTSRK